MQCQSQLAVMSGEPHRWRQHRDQEQQGTLSRDCRTAARSPSAESAASRGGYSIKGFLNTLKRGTSGSNAAKRSSASGIAPELGETMIQSVRTGGKNGGVDGDSPRVTISRRRTLAEMERLDVDVRNRRPEPLNTLSSPSSCNPCQPIIPSMRSPSQHKQPPHQAPQFSPVAARRNTVPQQRSAPSPRGGKPPVSPPVSPPLPSPNPAVTDASKEPSAHNAARRFSSCPVRSEAQRSPHSAASNASASAPAAAAITSFPLVKMWAKQTKQSAAGADGESRIFAEAEASTTAGGSARREDRARNELLRPPASSDTRSGSARHARGVSGSGRNIGESSARYSPRVGDSVALSEKTTDGKRQDAANGAMTDGVSDGESDGGDSDDEFVGLYWTAVEHRKAANAALSTALNRLGVGAGGVRAEASSGGGSARHCGRGNDAEGFGGDGKAEGLGGRRRRSSSWGNLAESQHPLPGGVGDGSGRFARRQLGRVVSGESFSGEGDIAKSLGRVGKEETDAAATAAAAAAAAAADFAFPRYGAASNGVARSGDEGARPGHRRRHSITCIDTELKEFLDLVDLEDDVDDEGDAGEAEKGEAEGGAAGKLEGDAEHEGGMRSNGGNLVRRDTRGRPGANATANATLSATASSTVCATATVRSPAAAAAAAAAASPAGSNPASMRTSNPSPRTRSGPLVPAHATSPGGRRPARRRRQTCIDADLKEFLDLIDSDEGEEGERGEGGEGGEKGKAGEAGEGEGRRVSFEFDTPEAAASARRGAAAAGAAAPAAPDNAAVAELLFNRWRPATLAPPVSASASAAAPAAAPAAASAASATGSASSSALAVPPDFAGSQSHRRRHSITCIDTELKEFLDLVDQEDDVDEFISTRVVHLPAPLPTVTDPLVPSPYSARAAAAEERAGSGNSKTPSGSGSSSSVFSTALKPLSPDDLPLGYSASSPTPLSPASLVSPTASPLSSPSAPVAAATRFPRHAPAALAPGVSSAPKGGAVAARATAEVARRGTCAGSDAARVGASQSGGVASLWAAASHNPTIVQPCRPPVAAAAASAAVPRAAYTGGASAAAPAPAPAAAAAADRATAQPANSLRLHGRRLSTGDLSALLGGSSLETGAFDYTSGYPTGNPAGYPIGKAAGATMGADLTTPGAITGSGGGSSSEQPRQMCLSEARRIAGVCYPSIAAGSSAPGPSGPSGPPVPPAFLVPPASLGPLTPPRAASNGNLPGGDIARASESARAAPRVGQDVLGNAVPGSACEFFPARGKLLRPGTPGVPSLGVVGGASDGAMTTPLAAASPPAASAGSKGSHARAHHRRSSSAVVVPQSCELLGHVSPESGHGSGRITSMGPYSPISAAVQKGACGTRPLRESARKFNVNSIAHALETAQLGHAYAKHSGVA